VKTVHITRGLQGSGKTTWAKSLIRKNPATYKRVNKDDLRDMLDAGQYSLDNEEFILEIRNEIIRRALSRGKDVIVDDTNGNPAHLEAVIDIAKEFNARVKIKDFTKVPIEACIERDLARPRSVGQSVIRKTYKQYFAPPVVRSIL
jgi:predicted kinase